VAGPRRNRSSVPKGSRAVGHGSALLQVETSSLVRDDGRASTILRWDLRMRRRAMAQESDATLTDLREAHATLTAEIRRLRLTARVAAALLALGIVAVGAYLRHGSSQPDGSATVRARLVKAEQFAVTDHDGNVRARLSIAE